MQYGKWDEVSICAKQPNLQMCTHISELIDYSFDIAFIALRDKQDEITDRLENELVNLAVTDEQIQYILVSMCMSLVGLTAVIISFMFVRVIKDKSSVYAILSYIPDNDIRKIINDSNNLELERVKYKKAWIVNSEGNQELFWRKIISRNHFNNNMDNFNALNNPQIIDTPKEKFQNIKSKEESKFGKSATTLEIPDIAQKTQERGTINDETENQMKIEKHESEIEIEKKEIKETESQIKRKEVLSEIEYFL